MQPAYQIVLRVWASIGVVTPARDDCPMVSNEEFFRFQKPAAVLKHGLLRRYAVYFAGKAGSRTGGRVAYVDGYAGPGRYEDGEAASPVLFTQAAEQTSTFERIAKCIFVEADRDHATALGDEFADKGNVTVIEGQFGEHAHDVITQAAGHATLIFVDPFSLGIDAGLLAEILERSSRQQPIDVIYHFSDSALARLAERVVQASEGDRVDHLASQIDELLAGEDWRREFLHKEEQSSFEVAAGLARKFAGEVAKASNTRTITVDVRQRPGHLPIYSLCLFSKYDRAIWDFIDMAGGAHVDWIARCENDDRDAHVAALRLDERPTLFDLEITEVDRSKIDDAIGEQVVPYLLDRVPKVLRQGPRRFVDAPELILGEMHGRARTTHVRTAVKALYAQGLVDSDGKGDFFMTPIALVE